MVNTFRWMILLIGLTVVIGSIMVTSAQNQVIITINSPSEGKTVYSNMITVSGIATPTGEAYIDSVTVKDVPAGRDSWRAEISLDEGWNSIKVIATDAFGNNESKIRTVFYKKNSTIPNGPQIDNRPTPTPTPIPTPTPTPTPTGRISITTIPPGAEVYLDTSPKDTSPTGITNITLENVTEGRHGVKVIKYGYHSEPRREIYLWGGETRKLDIELKPLKGSITVNSTPVNASVYLDNVYIKNITTPCMLSEVVVGLHTIKLNKSDYFNETEDVSVSVDKIPHLHVNLRGYGSINISSVPPGAKLYLDGNYTGETPKNISKVELGNHSIKLTKSDYFNLTKNVSLSVGETLSLNENLTGYGFLNISSNPSGACVYLEGDYKGITPVNIPKVVVGQYFLKLNKSDYEDVEMTINVSVGKTTPHVDVPLSESLSCSRVISQLSKFIQSPIVVVIGGIFGVIGGIFYIINFFLRNRQKREKWYQVPIDEDVNQNPLKKYILKFIQYISERKKRSK